VHAEKVGRGVKGTFSTCPPSIAGSKLRAEPAHQKRRGRGRERAPSALRARWLVESAFIPNSPIHSALRNRLLADAMRTLPALVPFVIEEATEESLQSAALGILHCWRAVWPMTGAWRHVPTVQSFFHEPRFGVSKPTGITIPIDRQSAIRPNVPDPPTREKTRVQCHSHP
jgi:hypothetical protein